MQKLTSSCSDLKKLELRYCDLTEVDCRDLSTQLEELSLIRCEVPLKWFAKNKFQNLTFLNLSGSSRICTVHMQDLANSSVINKLEVLILKDCYRINDKSVEILVDFKRLKRLDLSETDASQYGLQLVSARMTGSLVYVNVKKCKNINKNEVNLVRQSFLNNPNFQIDF